MIQELDQVALTADLPEARLVAGDLGTVVHTFDTGDYVVVEFFAANGRTIAVTTVPISQVRAIEETDVMHVRTMV